MADTSAPGPSTLKMIGIAGPYSAPTAEQRSANLAALNHMAVEVLRRGYAPVIGVHAALPIVQLLPEPERYEAIMTISLALIDCCDALLVIGSSPGADRERLLMESKGLPIYTSPDELPPRQAK